MSKNMGNSDRVLRLFVAAALVWLYTSALVTGLFAVLVLIVAGVFILTALFGFCPLYRLFGIRTNKHKK